MEIMANLASVVIGCFIGAIIGNCLFDTFSKKPTVKTTMNFYILQDEDGKLLVKDTSYQEQDE